MGGLGTSHSETIFQNVTIPSSPNKLTLSLWIQIVTEEDSATKAHDKLVIQINDSGGNRLKTLKSLWNLHNTSGYVAHSFDVSEYKGRKIQLYMKATEDNGKTTSFLVDNVTLVAQ